MQEQWRDIPGYEGLYQVSDLGNVKSLNRIDSRNRKLIGKILKPSKTEFYYSVGLSKNGSTKTYRIHSIMAITFLNHKSSRNIHVDHINGNRFDNNINNIRIVTARENSFNTNKKPRLGYSFYPSRNKYKVQVYFNKKSRYIGYFNTEQEAKEAYNNFLITNK